MRQSLNVESGLNDGICVPLLLILLATVSGAGGESHPLRVFAEQLGYGLLGGLAAGALAAAVVILAGGRHLIDDAWRQIIPLTAAVLGTGSRTPWAVRGSSPRSWAARCSACSLAAKLWE